MGKVRKKKETNTKRVGRIPPIAGRCRAAQLSIIKQMSMQLSRGSAVDYQADERAGVAGSAGDYQADERAGVAGLSWRISSR